MINGIQYNKEKLIFEFQGGDQFYDYFILQISSNSHI
jgi:hypothetical protein